MEENQGIIFGSWVNRYHDSEGNLLAPEEVPPHEILASITDAKKVDWKGTFFETLFSTMEWGLRSHPTAQISSYLRVPRKIFAKRLQAGEYSIFHIETTRRWWKADIRFRVIPHQITYIGSLQCHLYDIRKEGKIRIGRGIRKGNRCQVLISDNLDKDQALFEKTFKIFNQDLDWKIYIRLMEGKIRGIWEKHEKMKLPSVEKGYVIKEESLAPQPSASIDVFPST